MQEQSKKIKKSLGGLHLEFEERQWAVISHLASFLGFVVPFLNIAGPLLVWTSLRDDSQMVAAHALAELNFQITVTIGIVISFVLALGFIGVPLLFIVGLYGVFGTIKAAMSASNGELYRYPFSYEFIKQ